jgi:hypothetical protein
MTQTAYGPESSSSSPSPFLSEQLKAVSSFEVLLFRTRFDQHCHPYLQSVGGAARPLCVLFFSHHSSPSNAKLTPSVAHIILSLVCTSSVRMWPSQCLAFVPVLSHSLPSYPILPAASCVTHATHLAVSAKMSDCLGFSPQI